MAPKPYDVIVAGLGAMGCATACQLTLRGQRVLGLDRFAPGHAFGSSHGDSRIIREIYFEDPLYVPIVRRAYELWHVLEARTGRRLLFETGGLMMGPSDGQIVSGTLRAAREWRMPHTLLSPADVTREFPAFRPRDADVAVLDPRAGYLEPEACNAAHLEVAAAGGADLRFDEPVLSWAAEAGGVRVTTPLETYAAGRLVLSVGARIQTVLSDLTVPVEVERQVVHWFDPDPSDARYDAARFPIYAYEFSRRRLVYGFPRLSSGVKAAVMHEGERPVDADHVRRTIEPSEALPLRDALGRILPELARAPIRDSSVCLFTNMPDGHFLIDFHPAHPQVLLSSACSGHGFKFASAIGEIQADLLMTGRARFNLDSFRIRSL